MLLHKDLDAYKLSIDLVTEIYQITTNFPREEVFGLVSQMRRSAISIPSNIAEGAARNYSKEYVQFLHISLGSASELDTQLLISTRLKFISETDYQNLSEKIQTISRLIQGLIRKNKSKE